MHAVLQKTHCFDLFGPKLAGHRFDVIASFAYWQLNILYVIILAGLDLKGLDKFKINDEVFIKLPPRFRFSGQFTTPIDW